MIQRLGLLGVMLLSAGLALAQTCSIDMGRGWPAGMANYGQAAAALLGGEPSQGVAWLDLPKRGEESQLLLEPSADGMWRVLHAVADTRIHHVVADRSSFGVQLRLQQEPKVRQAPIPEGLARRIVAAWKQVVLPLALDAREPPLIDSENAASLLIDGKRLSGHMPNCMAINRLTDINLLLVDLAGSSERKHEKRYEAIARALDKYEERLAAGKI